MDNGSWKHFEFQSMNEVTDGLRWYWSYEALTSYQNKVVVTTYVLFSGKIRNPMTELRAGENVYRIISIIMQDKNADQVIENIQQKMQAETLMVKEDLVPLSLCLLMGGTLPLKERIKAAFAITRKTEGICMEEIKEGIRMTKLGQMLM